MLNKIIYTGTGDRIIENKLEELMVKKKIENILQIKRGNIYQLPKKNEAVVACVSGGLDSVINLAILMEEFNLIVYPLFINRGQSNYEWEKKSLEFFEEYFLTKYPQKYKKYLEIELDTPAKGYKDLLREHKNSTKNYVGYPARNPIIALSAMEYAYALQSQDVKIRHVFTTHTADDPVLHSTLTALRIDNLLMCQITGDYTWYFTSLPIETELDNYYGKSYLVKWGSEINLPLEKTRSCYTKDRLHCGQCTPACVNRQKAFLDAGIVDDTKYLKRFKF